MSFIKIPSMGVLRSKSYYYSLPLIYFAMGINLWFLLIALGPVIFTAYSGWQKYPDLRKYIVISVSVALLAVKYFYSKPYFGLLMVIIIFIPVCGTIAWRTGKLAKKVNSNE